MGLCSHRWDYQLDGMHSCISDETSKIQTSFKISTFYRLETDNKHIKDEKGRNNFKITKTLNLSETPKNEDILIFTIDHLVNPIN